MTKYKKQIENFLKQADDEDKPSVDKMTEEEEKKNEITREIKDEVRNYEKQDINEVFNEDTPDEYFEQEVGDSKVNISDNIDSVIKYIDKKSDALDSFDIEVLSFKYNIYEKVNEEIDNNIDIEGDDFKDFLASSAIIPILVRVKTNLDVEDKKKNGMIIFSVVKGDVITDDIIKLEDNDTYSLTNEGLSHAFNIIN